MSKAETLEKLHGLLERVRMRAGTRDGHRSNASSVATPVPAEPVEEPAQLTTWTPPPPDEPVADVGIAVDVDYVETTEVSRTVDVPVGGNLDSTERLVAVSAGAYSVTEGRDGHESDFGTHSDEPARDIPPPPHDLSDETADRAPASSRRPVMPEPEDRLEQMAFGAEEAPPPIHTPPPESGRVPAAPADEFDAEVQDVRGSRRTEEPMVVQTTRATFESSPAVAMMTGEARRSAPTTFSELLDETLAL